MDTQPAGDGLAAGTGTLGDLGQVAGRQAAHLSADDAAWEVADSQEAS